MTCIEMAFFPTNFMLQTSHDHDDHQPSTSLNPLLPSCTPQDFHGVASFLGKRSMSSYSAGVEAGQNLEGEEELSDDGSQAGEKKRRLNMEQVKTLEKNFELGNKLEPERKMQLARALGLQPRQIAIWFQNRRARWKTKQLEKDFELLKRQFDAVKAENDALQAQNHKLHAQIMALKNRDQQPTESINLNKETEGSCSNRSENSSEIKLDISRTTPTTTPTTTPAIDSHPHGGVTTTRPIFPPSHGGIRPAGGPATASAAAAAHLFHNSSRPPPPPPSDFHHHHPPHHHHQSVKEESLSSMFCPIDDQTGFWPWLEQQHFN